MEKEKVVLTVAQLLKIQIGLKKLAGVSESPGNFKAFNYSDEVRWNLAEIEVAVNHALEPFEVAKQALAKECAIVENMPLNTADASLVARAVRFFDGINAHKIKTAEIEIVKLKRTDFQRNNIAPTTLADLFPIIVHPG